MNVLTVDLIKEEAKKYPQIDPEAKTKYVEFSQRFHYSKLENLPDSELLDYVFRGTNKTNLCDTLENNRYYRDFGSFSTQGGVAVFGLYNKDGKWCACHKGINQRPLMDQVIEPLRIGREITNLLVAGAKTIEEWIKNDTLDTEGDYVKLFSKLKNVTKGYVDKNWVRKYYHMMFPEHLTTFYKEDFCDKVLNDFDLKWGGSLYAKLGRLACFAKECGVSTRMLGHIYDVLVYSQGLAGRLVKPTGAPANIPLVNTIAAGANMNGIEYPRNRIFFGAPGTGKSYLLNKQKSECFDDENVERVTFHPDYSYANFVGTYKPVTEQKTASTAADADVQEVVEILTDENKSGQEKYDALYEKLKDVIGVTRLPLLLSLYSVEGFKTKKEDGLYTSNNNDVEINHGKAMRRYVTPYSGKNAVTSSQIVYKFIPGPFMRVYTEAVKHPEKNYLLIIEEINRANVAAVFGDVFQLLDRTSGGVSEYPIQASEDIRNYLSSELGGNPSDYKKISIPENMYIWATMNSADQGVFPMDTAFKRRWNFEYIGINDCEKGIKGKYVWLANGTQKVEWNRLRKVINDFLAENKISEDKQLGPYFMDKEIVAPTGDEIDSDKFVASFKNKVIMYLYEDAARQKRDDLFSGCDGKRYSEICEEFDSNGVEIFDQSIVDELK